MQLARLWPHTYVQSKDLAQQEGLPTKFLESILLAMRRGGFLESKVGSGGGYRLSSSPREIVVGEVIRRLEGRLSLQDSPRRIEGTSGEIAVHLVNVKLTLAMEEVLDKLTLEELAQMAAKGGDLQQAMYYI